ncbi:hypothetical protein DFP72DRAFT_1049699 [Ephemerocybe angulata]|uniref:Uncharacterized protein n=1 Tax=Ephemerocybe angulata TaxID=980116 RepID=A0A8H6M022_9AGAR|nr:hypothetical protein DFP72DRAFT_1049699 [Tulosesus angulatus]
MDARWPAAVFRHSPRFRARCHYRPKDNSAPKFRCSPLSFAHTIDCNSGRRFSWLRLERKHDTGGRGKPKCDPDQAHIDRDPKTAHTTVCEQTNILWASIWRATCRYNPSLIEADGYFKQNGTGEGGLALAPGRALKSTFDDANAQSVWRTKTPRTAPSGECRITPISNVEAEAATEEEPSSKNAKMLSVSPWKYIRSGDAVDKLFDPPPAIQMDGDEGGGPG